MKVVKGLLIVVALLLATAIAVPLFIPLSTYIPQIEKIIAEKTSEPARIQSLKAAALPLPHVTAEGITIGKKPDIRIQAVTVTPDLSSLLSPVKVINGIEFVGVTITQDALGKMSGWTKSEGAALQVRVENVRLRDVRLEINKRMIGPLEAEVSLSADGQIEKAVVASADGKMHVAADAVKDKFFLRATAKDWSLPVGPAIKFDQFNAKGELSKTDLVIQDLQGSLYGGTVNGFSHLSWKDGWRLKGKLNTRQAELQSLALLVNPEVKVSGKLSAMSQFSSRAPTAGQLGDAMRAEASFNIEHGVLYNFDIAEAAKSVVKGGTKGGQTRFDEFSGRMLLDGSGYHFKDLVISSGVLAANGNLDISRKKQLAGRVNAEVKAGVSLVSVPLVVSGTLQDPVLAPTKGAVAGAVAGTALLGPGVGTSLGTKAGGVLEKLFGKKD